MTVHPIKRRETPAQKADRWRAVGAELLALEPKTLDQLEKAWAWFDAANELEMEPEERAA